MALVLLFSVSFLPGTKIFADEGVPGGELTEVGAQGEQVADPEAEPEVAQEETPVDATTELTNEDGEATLDAAEEPEDLDVSTQAIKEIVLDYYSLNDFHGSVEIGGKNPGLAKIQTFLKDQKAINPNSFLLSAGDHYQGSAISNLTKGAVVTEAFKEMGLKFSAVGNHEFDFGKDIIPVWAKDGGYKFLASNIEVESSMKPAGWDEYVKPYDIQEVTVDGKVIKIGFIGIATPETAYKTAAENVKGFTFTDPVAATNKYSKILKEKGVDAIISLTHLGAFQKEGKITGEVVDYANGVKDIDGIFLGHTHQLVEGVVNGIPVVQGASNGRSISNISLKFNLENDKLALADAKGTVTNLSDLIPNLTDDPAVANIVKKFNDELAPIKNQVLGELTVDLPHDTNTMQVSPMGQFIAKTLAEVGKTQIGVINGGGIRRGFDKGTITMGLMYELLPFDNYLVTLDLTGAELKKIIQHGIKPKDFRPGQFYGLEVILEADGTTIKEMRLLDGEPIKDNKVYSVSILDYIYTGGDKYNFKNSTNVVETFIPVRDLIADYMVAKKVIDPKYVDPFKAEFSEVINTVDYYSINDFHGNVESSGKNPGLARIQTYLNQQRLLNKNTFFVSAGDHFQGTAISNLTQGMVVNDILKEMGLLTSALGNHEFDFGSDKIPMWAEEGGYQYLASNIEVKEANKPAGWDKYVVPYKIQTVEVAGKEIQVGFIGIATPETKFKTAADNVVGFTFTDPVEATNKYSKILKDKGVDIILSLTHLGGFQKEGKITGEVVDYANGVKDIDGIFLGHTHQLVEGVVNGIPVVQGNYNGRGLSKISLNFGVKNEEVTFKGTTGKVIDMTALISQLDEDPKVKAIVDQYKKDLEPILNEKLADLKTDLPHDTDKVQVSTMGQFISKYLADVGGTQIAIVNGGGIRRGFEKGVITMGLMYELLPFDNTLVTMKLSGAELKKIIEHGLHPEDFRPGQFYGLKVWYNKDAEKGKRITSMRLLDGTLIEDTKMYTVSTLNFLMTGGDNYDFSKATDVVDTYIPIRDLIADKIKAEGTVSYTYQEHLKTGKDTTPGVTDETGKDKDKDKLPAAGAAGVGAYYTLGMMSLLSAGFISRKKSKKEA